MLALSLVSVPSSSMPASQGTCRDLKDRGSKETEQRRTRASEDEHLNCVATPNYPYSLGQLFNSLKAFCLSAKQE